MEEVIKREERSLNFELLRIFAILMVCIRNVKEKFDEI